MSLCLLSAAGYGELRVTVTRVSFGMSIDASSGVSRHGKAMYSKAVTDGEFAIDMIFRNHGEYAKVNSWFQGYGRGLSNPGSTIGPIRVIYPPRNFDRVGIPNSPITFGDNVRSVTYKMTMGFLTTRDVSTVASQFDNKSVDNQTKYFSPAGEQLTGDKGGVGDAIYDYQLDKTLSAIGTYLGIFGVGLGAIGRDD